MNFNEHINLISEAIKYQNVIEKLNLKISILEDDLKFERELNNKLSTELEELKRELATQIEFQSEV